MDVISKSDFTQYLEEKLSYYRKQPEFFGTDIATVEQILEKVQSGSFDLEENPPHGTGIVVGADVKEIEETFNRKLSMYRHKVEFKETSPPNGLIDHSERLKTDGAKLEMCEDLEPLFRQLLTLLSDSKKWENILHKQVDEFGAKISELIAQNAEKDKELSALHRKGSESSMEWSKALDEKEKEIEHWKREALMQARLYTAKNEKLNQAVEALEWYADRENWWRTVGGYGVQVSQIPGQAQDGGERAREAIQYIKGNP
jgi:hypothetical protein